MIHDNGEPWLCIFCAQLIEAATLEARWDHVLDVHRAELLAAKATVVISRPLTKR